MIREMISGICMALADSVPGVSGGTIAFIMGFYDQFIGSIHELAFGSMDKKKTAIRYLIKLGVGWVIGMIAAVLVLTSVFESNIYLISSLFIGFILGAIPLIAREEKDAIKGQYKNFGFFVLGLLLVAGITYFNGSSDITKLTLDTFSIGKAIYIFVIGMIAISAMFLPGISGSTLLLIFGAYMPVMNAVKEILGLNFAYVPMMIFFGSGILVGSVTVVKGIKVCLERHRSKTIYAIMGMMVGSLYAIVMGPTTLEMPVAPLSLSSFNWLAAIVGALLVLGLEVAKEKK